MQRCALAISMALWLAFAIAACDGESAGREGPGLTPGGTTPVARSTVTRAAARDCASTHEAAVFCADTRDMESARVVRIIDGDTLDVTIGGREERVRIFGIDTPERGERCAPEASALLADLAGEDVRLRADVRERDRNGRLLRYVYQPDGVSIDAVLIDEGLAFAWTRDGALRDELVALEANARLARTGCLWAP